jgi:hypothetical protein
LFQTLFIKTSFISLEPIKITYFAFLSSPLLLPAYANFNYLLFAVNPALYSQTFAFLITEYLVTSKPYTSSKLSMARSGSI